MYFSSICLCLKYSKWVFRSKISSKGSNATWHYVQTAKTNIFTNEIAFFLNYFGRSAKIVLSNENPVVKLVWIVTIHFWIFFVVNLAIRERVSWKFCLLCFNVPRCSIQSNSVWYTHKLGPAHWDLQKCKWWLTQINTLPNLYI